MTNRLDSSETEKTPEDQLAELLAEKGPSDPEARTALLKWTAEQERLVEASGDPIEVIKFNLRRARLYFQAGFTEEAFENFEAARTQAWNEQRMELYAAIEREMNKLGF